MRTCVLFGKGYYWERAADGRLELVPADLEPVKTALPEGVSFDDLMTFLGRIEADG